MNHRDSLLILTLLVIAILSACQDTETTQPNGDTECALDAIPAAARGADISRDIRTYHIDVTKLGEMAADANVKLRKTFPAPSKLATMGTASPFR